jgi:hypothetical protein
LGRAFSDGFDIRRCGIVLNTSRPALDLPFRWPLDGCELQYSVGSFFKSFGFRSCPLRKAADVMFWKLVKALAFFCAVWSVLVIGGYVIPALLNHQF